MTFFFEVLIAGLLSGMLYALVALGFVLIFKASGVFNFAQGAMVYFAALTFVGVGEKLLLWFGWAPGSFASFLGSLLVTLAAMVVLAILIERFMLRGLVNQPLITLFMATIGLTFFIDGLAQLIWGSNVRGLDIGIADEPVMWLLDSANMLVSKFDLTAAAIAAILVAVLTVFFQYTKTGRALRAVADDHQAALSIGVPLERIWVIVWVAAGVVALVAGLIWGARNGVQYALSFTALKALPVLILGGFTSIPGAIVGGLIIGASEKLAEVYLGPYVGGGIDSWFPYIMALAFLLIRPEGLFGEKHIDRV
ncbi:branched-chain amino acid ABC transporter permease [Hydrogenophilus thermoluteolus]|mgnify:CR=1 FL=1|nr:branched-chain amino acid ABC transporter permease [Hydrogenophilus thermoluteolus]MBW7657562.1 branched-chain amino acid ABC transporter permease [Hydrogenophilus thermoluteolus]HCO78192.1 branched-chain amino acid ABC transporter permease [Rhodocyclaceae bacterium]HNQ48487.1 branched-chain amino acid ABC transporter permease [Hydrogenophilus thermoluteolus]HNU19585.1 branched-chain amino acid ABC transporter permease [Hydrogenophilus thermoluteolus]